MLQEFFSTYYLVIFVGVVIVAMAVLNYIHRRRQVAYEEAANVFDFHLNKKSQLTSGQYKAVSVGAVYSQQQSAFINSLETGLEKERVMEIVRNWWGVHDSEEAVAKLNYLQRKGFDFYFPTAYKAFLADSEEKKKQIVLDGILNDPLLADEDEETVTEDIQKAYSQQYHLTETYEELIGDKIIRTREDLLRYGVVGWDCGRLNFFARLCYDAGYISEEQAWKYINKAYDKAQKRFTTWEDFGKSYVIGRAMWGGAEYDNSEIADIARHLWQDDESPWVRMPL